MHRADFALKPERTGPYQFLKNVSYLLFNFILFYFLVKSIKAGAEKSVEVLDYDLLGYDLV
jgi:hypothetical protein